MKQKRHRRINALVEEDIITKEQAEQRKETIQEKRQRMLNKKRFERSFGKGFKKGVE